MGKATITAMTLDGKEIASWETHDDGRHARRDPRDAVCEAASDYLLGLKDGEFAELNGGLDDLHAALRKAVDAWGSWLDEHEGQ
jgi:hypothetical protein